MLVLYEGVAPRLRVLRRHHHPDALHSPVLLKLALQLALAGDREVYKGFSFKVRYLV